MENTNEIAACYCCRGDGKDHNYFREFNKRPQTSMPDPLHDLASHGSDASRTGALTLKDVKMAARKALPMRRSGSCMSR